MASPGSFIRSAARATSSAYRRLPIRWRLAGGSALLTLVILLGFATIVGVLTTRQIESEFDRQVADAATDLQGRVRPRIVLEDDAFLRYDFSRLAKESPDLDTYAATQDAVIRLVTGEGVVLKATADAPYLPPPRQKSQDYAGYRIESRPIELRGGFFTCSTRASCPPRGRPLTACASSSDWACSPALRRWHA